MHTTEFRCELENFKREIENRGYTEKEDFIKLLNYYYDLSVLDFCYLKEAYKNHVSSTTLKCSVLQLSNE